MKPLGEVCNIQNGFAFKSKDYTESGARVIRIGNVQKGLIGDKSPRFMDLERLSEFSRFQIYENDILISLTGDVGRVGRFPEHLLPALLNQRVGRFQDIDSSSMISEFLFHVLNSDWFEKLVIESSEGAAQMNSSTKKIKAIPIPIPPLEEQERIVEVLDEAFAAIDKAKANIERNLTNARELYQSRLNDIFSNRSEDWEVKPLGEIAKRVCVGHVGSTSKYYVDEGGVPFFRTGDLRNEYLSLPASKSIQAEFHEKLVKSQLNANDLVISRVISERVICSIVPSGIAQANCANVVIAKIGDEQSAKFLSAQLSSKNSQDYFLGNKVGSAQQVVNTKILSAWPVLWPPHDEQKRIITELDTFRDMRKNLEVHYQTELDNLEELRQSILEQAFEGKLTEPVAA